MDPTERLKKLDHKIYFKRKIRHRESSSGIAPEEPTETEAFLENIMYGRIAGGNRKAQ